MAAWIIAEVSPDILLLLGFDYDLEGHGLAAFRDRLEALGAAYPYAFAGPPNTGVATGRDLDKNGSLGEARDAQGWGRFRGSGGMALLSRYPIGHVTDFSAVLWRDIPDPILPPGWYDAEDLAVLRLSTTAHWQVEVLHPTQPFHVLAYYAGPPVFDGPEDRNGRRTHDETAFWLHHLDGAAPAGPLVILGGSNLDPNDGDGRGEVMRALLDHPRLHDPKPRSKGGQRAAQQGGANTAHRGDPAFDTTDWTDDPGPGNLRVDYALPSTEFTLSGSGVFWPAPDDPKAALLGVEGQRATRHRLVWADVVFKGQ